MTNEEMAVKITEVESRSKSNTHRIDTMEKNQEALQSLATSVAVIATQQDSMRKTVESIDDKVSVLEKKPGKRWDSLVEKILLVIAGAFLAWLMGGSVLA